MTRAMTSISQGGKRVRVLEQGRVGNTKARREESINNCLLCTVRRLCSSPSPFCRPTQQLLLDPTPRFLLSFFLSFFLNGRTEGWGRERLRDGQDERGNKMLARRGERERGSNNTKRKRGPADVY